jgi:hypothetical protein
MAKKNKPEPKEKVVEEKKVAPKVKEAAVEEICWNCKWYAAGPAIYSGPHCENPASPMYRKRMRETQSCEAFEAKGDYVPHGAARTQTQKVETKKRPAIAVDENGLYGEGEKTLNDSGANSVSHNIFDEPTS